MNRLVNFMVRLLLVSGVIATCLGYLYHRPAEPTEVLESVQPLVINQIRDEFKLITNEIIVERSFIHSDFLGFNIKGLRKSALIQITAKAALGYDSLQIQEIGSDTFVISPPTIQYFEPDILWLDREGSPFIDYSAEDITSLQRNIIKIMKEEVDSSIELSLSQLEQKQLINKLQRVHDIRIYVK